MMSEQTSSGVYGSRFILIALALVAGCGSGSSGADGKQQTVPPRYWTKTGEETCGTMAGRPYCFSNRYIEAKSWKNDTATGFLFYVPIKDKELSECNRKWYSLVGEYPHIQLRVGETPPDDTFEKKYYRVRELKIGSSNKDIIDPIINFNLFEMKCIRLKTESFLKEEMMCHGGDIAENKPAFFFSCNWDGSVPNPGCSDELYVDGLEYSISYSKRCMPFVRKIRQHMIDFIAAGRLLGGM